MTDYRVGDVVAYVYEDHEPSVGIVVEKEMEQGIVILRIRFTEGKFADGAYWCEDLQYVWLVEPVEDEDIPDDAGLTAYECPTHFDCDGSRCGLLHDEPIDYLADVDEPTAEEMEEALSIFDTPELEAAIDMAIGDMSPTDLRWLDPKRVAALNAAVNSYAHLPVAIDSGHILNIARFLIDEEFVVGRVTA